MLWAFEFSLFYATNLLKANILRGFAQTLDSYKLILYACIEVRL